MQSQYTGTTLQTKLWLIGLLSLIDFNPSFNQIQAEKNTCTVFRCPRPWQLAFWITYEHSRKVFGLATQNPHIMSEWDKLEAPGFFMILPIFGIASNLDFNIRFLNLFGKTNSLLQIILQLSSLGAEICIHPGGTKTLLNSRDF